MIVAGIVAYVLIAGYVSMVLASYVGAKLKAEGKTVKKRLLNPDYDKWLNAPVLDEGIKISEKYPDHKGVPKYRYVEVSKRWDDQASTTMIVAAPFIWPIALPVYTAYYIGMLIIWLSKQVYNSADYIGSELGNPRTNTRRKNADKHTNS